MARSHREDHRRSRRTPRVLRLRRRELGPPTHRELDRVNVRQRQAASTRHQRPRLPRRRHRLGIQADRVCPSPVPHDQCTPPGRPRPPSPTGNKSNGPTNRTPNRTPPDTPIHRIWLFHNSRSTKSSGVSRRHTVASALAQLFRAGLSRYEARHSGTNLFEELQVLLTNVELGGQLRIWDQSVQG